MAGNTVFKLKRSSVAGKVPNTSTLSIGELALNLTDQKLFSSDGTNVWETGANLTSLVVSTNTTVNNVIVTGKVTANGTGGVNGQVLTTNGSSVYWSTVTSSNGGSNAAYGVIPVFQQFTANGSATTFTVTGGYTSNQVSVYLNGVLLRSGTEVDVTSGTAVVLTDAPANGSFIDVIGASTLYSGGINTIVNQQFTANGSANNFTISGGYLASTVQVFLNGVKQIPGTDVIVTSGTDVVFTTAPANGHIVDVWGYQTTAVVAGEWTIGNVHVENNRIYIGNSTVNSVSNATSFNVSNTTAQTNITPTSIFLGNSSVNCVINSTSVYVNGIDYNPTTALAIAVALS